MGPNLPDLYNLCVDLSVSVMECGSEKADSEDESIDVILQNIPKGMSVYIIYYINDCNSFQIRHTSYFECLTLSIQCIDITLYKIG